MINNFNEKTIVPLSALFLAVASSSSSAALPKEVATAFSGVSADFTSMATLAWPVIGTVAGGFILIRLFKRFTKAAI
jgi:hypothetical protein